MDEITLNIADSTYAEKVNFLATLQPILSVEAEDLPFEITINGYSRDTWSMKQSDSTIWKTGWFKGTDSKKNLPGFLKYLKERRKAAFAKFESEKTGQMCTALFVVPYDQPAFTDSTDDNMLYAQYCLDDKLLKFKAAAPTPQQLSKGNSITVKHKDFETKNIIASEPKGLLGSLLGAQHRTNQHLDSVVRKRDKKIDQSGGTSSEQVIAKFRGMIERILLGFDKSCATEIRIPISLSEITKDLLSLEEKEKVTIGILKYIVYEQVEEINNSWVAIKETAGFLDEANILVYKEGYIPPEVLEDLNKGEQTEEAIQLQRFVRDAMSKEENKKVKMIQEQNCKKLSSETVQGQVSVLNTNKRDRRSIEEIQKLMMTSNKRNRTAED